LNLLQLLVLRQTLLRLLQQRQQQRSLEVALP
jgi:hypothetical protein